MMTEASWITACAARPLRWAKVSARSHRSAEQFLCAALYLIPTTVITPNFSLIQIEALGFFANRLQCAIAANCMQVIAVAGMA